MIVLFTSQNNDHDLYAGSQVFSAVPDASNPTLCQAIIYIGDGAKNLDGTGGSFTMSITMGSQALEPDPETIAVGAGCTRAVFKTDVLAVPPNQGIAITITSPNSADTDVDVIAYLYDLFPLNVASGIVESDCQLVEGADATTELQAAAQAAIEANHLDHLLASAASDQAVNNSFIALLGTASGIWTDFDETTDSLQAIRDQQTDIETDVTAILADTGTDGVVVAVASKTGYALSAVGVDDILDEIVEGTYSVREMLRLMAAALCGKASGGGTTTITFRDTGDATDRIVATVDANGNRTAVTLDET